MHFKNLTLSVFMLSAALVFVSCEDDSPEVVTETIDSSVPTSDLTVQQQGAFVAENMTPTAGTVQVGTDQANSTFLRLSEDFMTAVGTGTVTVYFSTSETFVADPMAGNPDLLLIGAVQENGEHFFKLDNVPSSEFTHVLLWCASVGIPFGNAELQAQ